MKKKYSVVALFSGAGGLDMGFCNKGFKLLWANDFDKDACATHAKWSGSEVVPAAEDRKDLKKKKIVCGDIGKVDFDNIPKADVILGGFPCQGFSMAGPRKLDDSRNTLYQYFVRLVELQQPMAFVAENVKGLLNLGEGCIKDAILADFESKGYDVFLKIVNAADYKVPEDRYRIFIVGFRKSLGIKEFSLPDPCKKRVTLREALKDIPEPAPEDVCTASYSPRYMSRNRKRGWDEVSFTIPAMAKQVALHPSSPDMIRIDANNFEFGTGAPTRRFSWQEAAAIQTFPKGMEFCGNLTSKYKQIGNAVPVKLAEVVAKAIYDALESVRGDE